MYRPTTVREQMLYAIGAVVLAVIVLLVMVTLYVTQHQLYALGERNAEDQVEAIAARAGFAAIVGADNPAVAKELLQETVGRNGILGAALLDAAGRTLARVEPTPDVLAPCHSRAPAPTTVGQVQSAHLEHLWCVYAPVLRRTATGLCTAESCALGELRVAASTAPVDAIVHRLIAAILIMGIVLLAAAIASLWRVADRISGPLRDIAAVMRRFSAGERSARAVEYGPDEARMISRVYNELIDAQELQARTLEDTVERRTQELKAATLAAQDAERYKTTFMAHVSHDMRTPLHVIQAEASEVMHELEFWSGSERARGHLTIIARQASELAVRVTQVLELARGEASRDDLDLQTVTLARLKGCILDKAETLARTNGNKLIIEAADAEVVTDVDRVVQILMNLIDNACKYTERGRVEVHLVREGNTFVLRVADTGIGIPEQALPHIWREFRQSPSADGRRVSGFGLGLAIVQRYVKLLGGACEVSSVLHGGTAVSVRLPASRPSTAIAIPSGQ